MAEKKDTEEGAHGFAPFLAGLSSGYAHIECTETLNKLLKDLRAVAENRGPKGKAKGKLTLTIEFEVNANGTARTTYDVTKKAPKPDREEDSYWLTRNANLTRKNPKQQELPHIREVVAPEQRGDVDAPEVSRL